MDKSLVLKTIQNAKQQYVNMWHPDNILWSVSKDKMFSYGIHVNILKELVLEK
jgi:hypothetical protein